VDALIAILESFKVPLIIVVTVILLAIIFRRQIAELIASTAAFEIDPEKRRWQVKFGERVRQEQEKVTAIPRQTTASSAVTAASPTGAKQTGRDMVLEAWGAVKQAVYDGCIANRMTVTPSSGLPDAARRLGDARELSPDLVGLIEFLYELGREVAGDPGLRPQDDDARVYWTLAYSAAHGLGLSVLVPNEGGGPQEGARRRATMVGGNFIQPSPGVPSAALVAIAGPMKGQQYPIDKANYRLGRSANHDLCAAADDSVSGNHACLCYENGGLFLYDQNSLNGTFLNEERVTATPVMVRHGDRIRLGESVFEAVGSSASSVKDPIKDPIKKPSGRSVVR
jgi:FHA domain